MLMDGPTEEVLAAYEAKTEGDPKARRKKK
jgi:hypothetical protein